MDLRFRAGLSGIVFLIILLVVGLNDNWDYGFGFGLILALFIFFITSDTFKEMQRKEAEKRARQQAFLAEDAAIRYEEAQREMGRLEGRAEHNKQRIEALKQAKLNQQRQRERRERYNKAYEKAKKAYGIR